jgi:hypothetical protein
LGRGVEVSKTKGSYSCHSGRKTHGLYMSKSSIRYNPEPVKSTSHLHNPTPYDAPLHYITLHYITLHFNLTSFSRAFPKRSSNKILPQFFVNRTVRKLDLKYLETSKCGAGEGWSSVGPTVREMEY